MTKARSYRKVQKIIKRSTSKYLKFSQMIFLIKVGMKGLADVNIFIPPPLGEYLTTTELDLPMPRITKGITGIDHLALPVILGISSCVAI